LLSFLGQRRWPDPQAKAKPKERDCRQWGPCLAVQLWRQGPMGARHGGWLFEGNRRLRLAGCRVLSALLRCWGPRRRLQLLRSGAALQGPCQGVASRLCPGMRWWSNWTQGKGRWLPQLACRGNATCSLLF
jgi:hypothetical protein